jgi:hypothetical protein
MVTSFTGMRASALSGAAFCASTGAWTASNREAAEIAWSAAGLIGSSFGAFTTLDEEGREEVTRRGRGRGL